MIPLPSLNLAAPSSSESSGTNTSGGNFYLGGNPNLAAIAGGSNAKWWVAGLVAVAFLGALVLIRRRK